MLNTKELFKGVMFPKHLGIDGINLSCLKQILFQFSLGSAILTHHDRKDWKFKP